MPNYEYKCKNCGHTFEALQSIKDDKFTHCWVCKKLTLERLIGIGSVVKFKGTGFYETDYKKGR